MDPQLLLSQAASLHQKGRLSEAEPLYRQALSIGPHSFEGQYLFAVLCYQQQRPAEALAAVEAALNVNPDAPDALTLHGILLAAGGKPEQALASFDRAVGRKPDHVDAWYNRGVTLASLERFEQAVPSFDRVLALRPKADVWNNRGSALLRLKQFALALQSFDQALALKSNLPGIFHNRGIALRGLKRFDEALASYDKALALAPDYADARLGRAVALQNLQRFEEARATLDKALAIAPEDPMALFILGEILCEENRIGEGLALFTQRAHQLYEASPASNETDPPHKRKHDDEQQDYLAAQGIAAPQGLYLAGGERLAAPAVNPANAAKITAQWISSSPQLVVIDDLLTPEALKKLRRFCWESIVWRKNYDDGYLGATLDYGFACPLLAQIAEELQSTFPAILGAHGLRMLWGFKYDSSLHGIRIHADQAAVNVNFWITPDEANLDPDHGGLVVWDKTAPLDWDTSQYNGDEAAARAFLTSHGARPITVPYRANRAVIFDSDLFHETDKIHFKDGYLDRRINITMLFGRRTFDGR